ncbi:MAG: hypothetical protein IT266_11510 [Saprospiraceae bacterium]|nr:hypothetical protein [Saprospiraceae bacterium]
MNLVDNALLALATIMWIGILFILFGKMNHVSGGDAVAGAVWSLIYLFLGFLLFMGAFVAWAYFRGGFNWVMPPLGPRWAWLVIGFTLVIFVSAMAALCKMSGAAGTGLPGHIVETAAWLLPALALFGGLLMVNGSWLGSYPEAMGKLLLLVAFWSSLAGSGVAVAAWVRNSATAAKEEVEAIGERDAERKKQMLSEIDQLDTALQFHSLLQFTDFRMDPEIRDRALARIHAVEGWPDAVARSLAGDAALEAFVFLAANDVPNKQPFVLGVEGGLQHTTEYVAKTLEGTSDPAVLSSEWFSWEMERILRTLDRLETTPSTHGEKLRQLREAFRTHGGGRPYEAADRLDRWLVDH